MTLNNSFLLTMAILINACAPIERTGSFTHQFIECRETNDINEEYHKPCNGNTFKTIPEQHWKSRQTYDW